MRVSFLSTCILGASAFRTNKYQEDLKSGQVSDCLCVFDVDRTLTSKQGHNDCPNTEPHPEIPDWAYYGGTLIVSEMMMRLQDSFCGQCYFGAVSAGTASGPNSAERAHFDSMVPAQYNVGGWVDGCPSPVSGTKILACGEGAKQTAVRDILTWMNQNHGISIADERVFFFDDKQNNIEGFQWTNYNAKQISCNSRDGNRGLCGGTFAEFTGETGNKLCDPNSGPAEEEEGAVFEMGAPGSYTVHDGKCGGQWIEFWRDGSYAHYGDGAHGGSPEACQQTCDEHRECSGFYTKNGICSHWRSGRQVSSTRSAPGHQCYVKGR